MRRSCSSRKSAPACQPALADPLRLQRVLRNLLDNALHHTPPGGLIRVEALPSANEPSLWVRVSDSGPGVPVDERERVFERFYRGERSRQRGEANPSRVGAGLGLAIADGLVRAQRGRIWVEPTASGGAAFTFTVPLATARGVDEPDAPKTGHVPPVRVVSLQHSHVKCAPFEAPDPSS